MRNKVTLMHSIFSGHDWQLGTVLKRMKLKRQNGIEKLPNRDTQKPN